MRSESRPSFPPLVGCLVLLAAVGLMLSVPVGVAEAKPKDRCHISPCPSQLFASTPDGREILFETRDRLVRQDLDQKLDIYRWRDGKVDLVTREPADRVRISKRLPRMAFISGRPLSRLDKDEAVDIYEISKGRLRLKTPAPRFPDRCGKEQCEYRLLASSADGKVIYLNARNRLTPNDRDANLDIYSLSGSRLRLVSAGPRAGGKDSQDVPGRNQMFELLHVGEGFVYFATSEPLVSEDKDRRIDLYRFEGGRVTLATPKPLHRDPDGFLAEINYSDAVPGRIYISTRNAWYGTKPSGQRNLYLVDPGQDPVLIHSGAAKFTGDDYYVSGYNGESADGSTVYFVTWEDIDPADTDGDWDLYSWSDGEKTLISTGPRGSTGRGYSGTQPLPYEEQQFIHASDNGDVFFITDDMLTERDEFTDYDVYMRSGSEVSLVSTDEHGFGLDGGNSEGVEHTRVFDDGRIFMTTKERWVGSDRDGVSDLYVREGNEVRQVSIGPMNGPEYDVGGGPTLAQSLGNDRYLVHSSARLTADDGDRNVDLFRVDLGRPDWTRRISAGALRIIKGPTQPSYTDGGPATFHFRQAGSKVRFECRIDKGRFRPCTSPKSYSGLDAGVHRFSVASTGRKGLGRAAAQDWTFNVNKATSTTLEVVHTSTSSQKAIVLKTTYSQPRRYELFLVDHEEVTRIGGGQATNLLAASPDLERILFRTDASLNPIEDTDAESDIYAWSGGNQDPVGPFPGGSNIAQSPAFGMADESAEKVSFASPLPLVSTDYDFAVDAYTYDDASSELELMSPGSSLEADATPLLFSPDGTAVLFYTDEALTLDDTDGKQSIYWSDGEQVRFVTTGGYITFEADDSTFKELRPEPVAMSPGGERVFFVTWVNLTGGTGGTRERVYEWTSLGFRSLSRGDALIAPETRNQITSRSELPPFTLQDRAISEDGSTVLMTSLDNMVPADNDARLDVYRSRDGLLELVGPATSEAEMEYMGSSADREKVVVSTSSALRPQDQNGTADLYLLGSGSPVLLTGAKETDPIPGHTFVWISEAGDQLAFTTKESLVAADRDESRDLYGWDDEEGISLLSNLEADYADLPLPPWVRTGDQGGVFYFMTTRSFDPADQNRRWDIYRLEAPGTIDLIPLDG